MSKVKITWLGHAAFKIEDSATVIYIDPWLENPSSPLNWKEVKDADLVLVTHDHFDHTGQAAEIVKQSGGMLVANVETARKFGSEGGVPNDNIANGGNGLNIGGSFTYKGVTVTMTQAYHSTASGTPTGYVVRLSDGINIYHAGDTGIFSEMELIGKLYPLTVALLPIGDVFTMDAYQAAHALTLLKPKIAIPMHYKSFPIIAQDASEFKKLASQIMPDTKVVVLEPGESFEIE